jgi:hypothetical protein
VAGGERDDQAPVVRPFSCADLNDLIKSLKTRWNMQLVRLRVERNFEKLRRQQTGRGGLLNFVRYFWHALEPRDRKLVDGWPLEAICDHLEALTFGDIPSNRLLMNVPPGFMKSLLTDVFWPAWEWGPCNMPHMRYVAFARGGTPVIFQGHHVW